MNALALPKFELTAGLGAAIGVLVLGALALVWAKSAIDERGVLEVGASAGKAAGDAAAGVVLGVGEAIGVPRTNESACDKALREGRLWDASFACPALRFIREGLFGSAEAHKPSSASTPGYVASSWIT